MQRLIDCKILVANGDIPAEQSLAPVLDVRGSSPNATTGPQSVPLAELADALARIDDEDELVAMRKQDTRRMAKQYYDRRLIALASETRIGG